MTAFSTKPFFAPFRIKEAAFVWKPRVGVFWKVKNIHQRQKFPDLLPFTDGMCFLKLFFDDKLCYVEASPSEPAFCPETNASSLLNRSKATLHQFNVCLHTQSSIVFTVESVYRTTFCFSERKEEITVTSAQKELSSVCTTDSFFCLTLCLCSKRATHGLCL